jgi:cell division protein ZapA (FtsZ GTPase activity inhibitor)
MKKVEVVKVKILGCEYAIKKKGEEDSYYEKIAGFVDEKMRAIVGKSSLLSIDRAAVLAALRICEELFRAKKASEEKEKLVRRELTEMTEMIESALR